MRCQMCSGENPPDAVSRIRLEWLVGGEPRVHETDVCGDCLRSKRKEFVREGDRLSIVAEYDEHMLTAVASGATSDVLEWISADGIRFKWTHGPLIDVFFHHTDTVPVHAISARLVSTYAQFRQVCQDWLNELDDHDRQGYAEHAAHYNR